MFLILCWPCWYWTISRMGVRRESSRQHAMATLLLLSRLDTRLNSRKGLLRARLRPLMKTGTRMEAASPIIITEVKWVGYRRTLLGPPVTLIKDTVRKVSLNISTVQS